MRQLFSGERERHASVQPMNREDDQKPAPRGPGENRGFLAGIEEAIQGISSSALLMLAGTGAFLALLPAWLNYDIISRDGAFQYVPLAQVFLEGRFLEGLMGEVDPFFPLIIAGIAWLTGLELELSGRIASYLAFVLTAVGMYKVGEILFRDRMVSLLAVLFLITNRQLVDRSIDCLKESLLLCCIIWGNYLVLKGISSIDKKKLSLVLGALMFFAGGLFRSTALVFLCAWLIIWVFHEEKGRLARAALFIAPVCGVLAVWAVNPELPVFRKSYQFGYFFVSSHGAGHILRSGASAVTKFFSTGNPLIILLGLTGLYRYRRDYYSGHLVLVLVMFLLVLTFWVFASDRYFLAPIMWIYPLAAFHTLEIIRSGTMLPRSFAVIALLSCMVLWAHLSFTPPDPDKLARRDAGEWILSRVGPGHEILSNRERLAFYAKGTGLPLDAFKKAPSSKVLAIDTGEEDGKMLQESLDSQGILPDKRFGSILIYLPRSGDLDETER